MIFRVLIFNFVMTLFSIVAYPKFKSRAKQSKEPERFWQERFGHLNEGFLSEINKAHEQNRKVIWVHAVSVGELLSLKKFISFLEEKFPNCLILISTVTPTGQQVAEPLKDKGCLVFYFPVDFHSVVKRVLLNIKPDMILLAEKEVWPNLILAANKLRIPVGIVNGRMSPNSLKSYRKVKWLLKAVFGSIQFCLTQTREDALRFQECGVLKSNIEVTGNMKYDQLESIECTEEEIKELKTNLGYSQDQLILISASTHPGEEKVILEAFQKTKQEIPGLNLILVPRHPERAEEVAAAVRGVGLDPVLDSVKTNIQLTSAQVLIIDAVGKLRQLYPIADLVVMGGSFVEHGGQNPIEPAGCSKAICTGPHIYNFHAVYQQLASHDAVVMIPDGSHLTSRISILLKDESRRKQLGLNAKTAMESMGGSSEKQAEWIRKYVEKGLSSPKSFVGDPSHY